MDSGPGERNRAEWIEADGGLSLRPDPHPDVSSAFGTPYKVDGKTLIRVVAVKTVDTGKATLGLRPNTKAAIEIDNGRVSVVHVTNPTKFILPGVAVGVWSIYRILETVRALRGKR